MKKSATVFVLAAAFLLAPVLSVSAHGNGDYDHDRDRSFHYNWNRSGVYYPQTVTSPYWCGSYWSSYSCPHYQPYAYSPYQNYSSFYPPYYSAYQPYASYYQQPGYFNGGAWIPYYGY